MHEQSIAASILDAVGEETARQEGSKVVAVHVRVGPLSGVDKEALTTAYDTARAGSAAAECRLLIEDVPVVVHCPQCNADRAATSFQDLRCSVCGNPTGKLVSGRELEIIAMEVFP